MKKSIIVCIVSVLFLSNNVHLYAQRASVELGVKAGINYSGSSLDNCDPIWGPNIGIVMDINLSRRFYLRTGLDYTMKGARSNNQYTNEPWYYDYIKDELVTFTGKYKNRNSFGYVQLPLLLGFRIPVSDKINLTLNAGGYISGGVYSKSKYEQDGVLTDSEGSHQVYYKGDWGNDWDDNFEQFDWGWVGGVGAEYKRFILNLNYESGIRSLNKVKYQYSYDGEVKKSKDWRNYNWSLSVGYKF